MLIDAGLSAQETVYRLRQIDVDPATLQAICITHEHRDHVYGAQSVSNHLSLPIYVNERTRKADRGLSRLSRIQEFETGHPFEVEGLVVHPIPLSHDSEDPVAFCLEKEGEKIASVTDLGLVTESVIQAIGGCHILILEFNHDPQLLQNGPYPLRLKDRVSSSHGHLSNEEAGKLLQAIVHPGLRHLFLAHISQTNNLPDLALLAAEQALQPTQIVPTLHMTWQNYVSPIASLHVS